MWMFECFWQLVNYVKVVFFLGFYGLGVGCDDEIELYSLIFGCLCCIQCVFQYKLCNIEFFGKLCCYEIIIVDVVIIVFLVFDEIVGVN